MNLKTLVIAVVIALGVFTGVVLFRYHIPYATAVTGFLGIDEFAPTAESVVYSIQTDPIGAIRTGGIFTTVLGVFRFGVGKISGFIKGVKDTRSQVSAVQNQVGDIGKGISSELGTVKDELSTQITSANTEISSVKTELSTEISSVKTELTDVQASIQENAGELQALREENTRMNNVIQANSQEMEALKARNAEMQNQLNAVINSLQEKARPADWSYSGD